MGYWSTVAIAIEKNEYTKQHLLLNKLPGLLKNSKYQTAFSNSAIFWFFDFIKWYESFPEISEVNAFLDSLSEESFGFIRIGGEEGDVEYYGVPHRFDMRVTQNIDLPVDF